MVDLRLIKPSLLDTMAGLKQGVKLTIDCYVHTLNSNYQLHRFSCLESLRVCILNKTIIPHHGNPTLQSYHGRPSQEIAEIIRQNRHLKSLHLCLRATPDPAPAHDHLLDEKENALDHIGKAVKELECLTLEGDLQFSQDAWTTWTNNFAWNKLRSLSLLGMPLISSVAAHLEGQLSGLHKLSLSSYRQISMTLNHPISVCDRPLELFFLTLNLTHLSFQGFHPDILVPALKTTGPTVRYLRFHIRGGPMYHQLFGQISYSTLLLSAAHIRMLQASCPALEWIGLDILRASLADGSQDTSTTASSSAVCSCSDLHRGSRHDVSGPQSSNADPRSDVVNQQVVSPTPPAPSGHGLIPPEGEASSVTSREGQGLPFKSFLASETDWSMIDALANIHSLRHVRFCLDRDQMHAWSLTMADVLATFARLRARKRGVPLESLVVRGFLHGRGSGLWIAWELGPRMATVEYRGYQKRLKEVWNTEDLVVLTHDEMDPSNWPEHPDWAISDGW